MNYEHFPIVSSTELLRARRCWSGALGLLLAAGMIGQSSAQTLTREYIRMGGKVIAVENFSANDSVTFSESAHFSQSTGENSVALTVTFAAPMLWSVETDDGPTGFVQVLSPVEEVDSDAGESVVITYAVGDNKTHDHRSQTIHIAGKAFRVTQYGLATVPSLPISVAWDGTLGGGAPTVAVTADAGARWSVASNSDWISIVSPAADGSGMHIGTGTGNVVLAVLKNGPGSQARVGSITIDGQVVTIQQAAPVPSIQCRPSALFRVGPYSQAVCSTFEGGLPVAAPGAQWSMVSSGSLVGASIVNGVFTPPLSPLNGQTVQITANWNGKSAADVITISVPSVTPPGKIAVSMVTKAFYGLTDLFTVMIGKYTGSEDGAQYAPMELLITSQPVSSASTQFKNSCHVKMSRLSTCAGSANSPIVLMNDAGTAQVPTTPLANSCPSSTNANVLANSQCMVDLTRSRVWWNAENPVGTGDPMKASQEWGQFYLAFMPTFSGSHQVWAKNTPSDPLSEAYKDYLIPWTYQYDLQVLESADAVLRPDDVRPGTNVYQASHSITTTSGFSVRTGASTTLVTDAGGYIDIQPEFHAPVGSELHVYVAH